MLYFYMLCILARLKIFALESLCSDKLMSCTEGLSHACFRLLHTENRAEILSCILQPVPYAESHSAEKQLRIPVREGRCLQMCTI